MRFTSVKVCLRSDTNTSQQHVRIITVCVICVLLSSSSVRCLLKQLLSSHVKVWDDVSLLGLILTQLAGVFPERVGSWTTGCLVSSVCFLLRVVFSEMRCPLTAALDSPRKKKSLQTVLVIRIHFVFQTEQTLDLTCAAQICWKHASYDITLSISAYLIFI